MRPWPGWSRGTDRGARASGPAAAVPADRGRRDRAAGAPGRAAPGDRYGPAPPGGQPGNCVSAARTRRERAARLLRWYPRAWRERYAEEFAELLIADMESGHGRPGARSTWPGPGSAARVATAGLARPRCPTGTDHRGARGRASLGALWAALAACLALGAAMWSELVIGWRSAAVTGGPGLVRRGRWPELSAPLATSASARDTGLARARRARRSPGPPAVAGSARGRPSAWCSRQRPPCSRSAVTISSSSGPAPAGTAARGRSFPVSPRGSSLFGRSRTGPLGYAGHTGRSCPGSAHRTWPGWRLARVALAAGVAAAVSLMRRAELSPRVLAVETGSPPRPAGSWASPRRLRRLGLDARRQPDMGGAGRPAASTPA